MENEISWDTLEKEFTSIDHAVRDPELVRMNEVCIATEQKIKVNRITDNDTLIGECRILDSKVMHLMERSVIVEGRVQLANGKDEEGFFEVADTGMSFNGFIYSTRNGEVELDYQLCAIADEKGQVIDPRKADGSAQYQPVVLQARRSEVSLEFDIVHPVQAAAWLDFVDENLVRNLDSYLLPEMEAGVKLTEIEDPYSIVSLNSIGVFEADLSYLAADERLYVKTLQAITVYANSCLSHDKALAHLVDMKGDCYLGDGAKSKEARIVENDRLVLIQGIGLRKQEPEGHRFVFAFSGYLLGDKPDVPPLELTMNFKDIQNIRSLR